MANVAGDSANPQIPAVSGKHTADGRGVVASSAQGVALEASATKDTAVFAHSSTGMGVDARSKTGRAVVASSAQGVALEASATKDTAVFAHSNTGMGVDARSKTGIALRASGGQYAGYFEGIVMVTGDIQLQNADCAEDFDALTADRIESGTVMVIDSSGALRPSTEAYDRRVAGVVSGAGDLKPGLVLGKQPGKPDRTPIALVGKVYCRVDADFGPIEIGDLLTTSSTAGHAMKAIEPARAFGAVIGKALRPWTSGQGLIPILVALQ